MAVREHELQAGDAELARFDQTQAVGDDRRTAVAATLFTAGAAALSAQIGGAETR
jgi:hypothetical protein